MQDTKIVVNVMTGEIQELPLTEEEQAQRELDAVTFAALPRILSRADFVVALTRTTPPILTEVEALVALERFPPTFMAALTDKPLAYRAAAIESWRTTTTVSRDSPLFLDLLAFHAAQRRLTDAQASALGDSIFARVA